MKVLVIGNGAREHAMVWKLAQSSRVEEIFVAPGNGGTAREPKTKNIPIEATQIKELCEFAQREKITLTIVGPEAPLALGIVDAFEKAHLLCFGPQKAAAQLESSKAYSKSFMQREGIPTAQFCVCNSVEEAKKALDNFHFPLVIKADGLAAGKGVVIVQHREEALETLENMMIHAQFGDAGHQVVIEEFLQGEEASFMVITDGEHILCLPTSQDHKARDNGDKGPNTGGMGAYSPAAVVTESIHHAVMERVIKPTLSGLAKDGIAYRGFLYAGLMISPRGDFHVLEFNCRLGDPEAEVLLMRLESDFAELCLKAAEGALANYTLSWDNKPALGVVLCAKGYPESYEKEIPITRLPQEDNPHVKIFHGGTGLRGQQLLTTGGRVMCVVAKGNSLLEAQKTAYAMAKQIHWKEVYYRTDIGYRAILGAV